MSDGRIKRELVLRLDISPFSFEEILLRGVGGYIQEGRRLPVSQSRNGSARAASRNYHMNTDFALLVCGWAS